MLWSTRLWGAWASVTAAHGLRARDSRALEHRLMGLVAGSTWDLPRPEIEPMSPVLAGGFFFSFNH